ncbi:MULTISPECIES: LysE family translocator [Bordetella]|uniref:Lysine transporter LysE n=1 Tax=Bordetella genomosp. 6 TaxID=463024 RepID=A0ABX4FFT0_9BORD|nr:MULTISPECIES: LysE family translocator [Bordetella]AOB28118.1 lysine transporter LysE [Bordetella bronchiseptica]ARP75550.1 lysine transporter LysE [Bordetella genomosp. 6]AZW45455.1 LysE family translocator [Bordetella bronchiseptica]MBN3266378.1 LysE family translocator [Bordetella bronchiseptica]OZI81026.1 lysine transporter LysE [Bordetella genomosp. 6]
MSLHTWLLYLIAVTGLSLTPGPNTLLALTHGAMHGHRKALCTITGGAFGFTLVIGLSMLGISALLKAWSPALILLKWAGGAYLVYLGIQLWRAPAVQLLPPAGSPSARGARLFGQGLLAAISNPKALLFFGAFLPQFIDPARSLATQFAVMAATFAAMEFVVEYGLARAAHKVRPFLQRAGRRFNKACGGMFAAMGIALPGT